MFKKLHRQFTFFCTLITSLILVGMSMVCLVMLEGQRAKSSYASFQNNMNSVLSYLEGQSVLSHQWILQIEDSYHLSLSIFDNGTPLYFDSVHKDTETEALTLQAKEIAKNTYALDLDNPSSMVISSYQAFAMTDDTGQDYYAFAALLPKQSGYISMIALYSLDLEEQQILMQRLLFIAVDCAAVILLAVFSYFFTKRMIRPLEENRQKQVQFIASASHELRSPLTVMLSSLAAMNIAPPQEAARFADTILREGRRMSRLIDDMLALASADNHSWSLHMQTIELDTLLLQTYEKFEPVALSKDLSFDVELPEAELIRIQADGERLTQVLSIIIDNAFSYTQSGGRIIIALKKEKEKALISIADNGPGIPDDQKELIFERFYRADKAHNEKKHFGLGLCIAADIMKLHKGSITVADTPGGGATFVLKFPLPRS